MYNGIIVLLFMGKKTNKKIDKADKIAKERLDEKKITEGLEAIYGKKGEIDLSTVQRKKRGFLEVMTKAVIALGVVSAILWGGFFVYHNLLVQQELQILQIELSGPEEVKSGEMVTIYFRYDFPYETALASLDLDVNVPSGFLIESFSEEPTNADDLIWRMGTQPRRTSGEISITGRWFSEVPSVNTVQAFARYKPINVNAEFEEITTFTLRTSDSIAKVDIEGPEEATADDEITYTITVRNESGLLMPSSRLLPEIPSSFIISESIPVLEPGFAPVWNIDALEPEEEREFLLRGTYASDTSGFEKWSAQLQFDQINQRITQANRQFYTDIIPSDLQVQLMIGGRNDILIIEPNAMMQTSILLENTSINDISGISALLDFDAEKRMPVRWSASTLGAGRLTADGIRYDDSVIGSLEAGGRTSLNAQFPIESRLTENDSRLMNAIVRVYRGSRELRSREVQIYITTSPEISAEINENDEVQIMVKAGTSPISDLRVRIPFGSQGRFIASDITKSDGDIADLTTSRIVWQIDALEANEEAILTIPLYDNEEDIAMGDLLINMIEFTGMYSEIKYDFRKTLSGLRR